MSTLSCPRCGSPFFLGDEYCGSCFHELSEISQAPSSLVGNDLSEEPQVNPFADRSADATASGSTHVSPPQEIPAAIPPIVGPPKPQTLADPIAADTRSGALICPTCNQTFSGAVRTCASCGGPLYHPCPHPDCVDKITGRTTLNPIGAKFCKTGGKRHPLGGPVPAVAPPDPPSRPFVAPSPPVPAPSPVPVGPPATAYLVILDRNGREAQRFRLKVGANHVGAGSPGENIVPDVDLRSLDPDDYISRRHAVVQVERDGITLTSLTHTNFTEMDGQKLSANVPVRVTESSMIRFCHLTAKISRG